MTRKQAREQAFLLMFQHEFKKNSTYNELLIANLESNYVTEDCFTDELCNVTMSNITDINNLIEKNSQKWDLSRISKVAISVLRIAIAEILYLDNIPIKVSINEAIEIAKKFANEDDATFVNGVLGGIVLSLEDK